ncbi:carbohydrate-binding module family 1 protein [Patellaria atrata CBS 101060]|uniref:AA9 family lytic polysaccharide monooxygenase n=1 Tax=Patellaria atrata CBS 101060 TaxID=1346257 RepID=A0A9P4SJR9_9PEZI|nr:carbohydrate-binding module family 1 protein [Patellaria atrata CBS 101060]
MKTFALLALAAVAKLANAHATVFAVFINGVDQGLGNSASGYIRSPPNNSPLVDVTSPDMRCNVNNSPAAKTLKVKAGDEVTFEWHHNTRDASDDIIDISHLGPVMTYIAPSSSNGAGNVWLKLAEDGFAAGKWAVERLVQNRGKHSVKIPNIAAGQYLLRPEIIALHEGFRLQGAQFYMECVQIEVQGTGGVPLPAGAAIPGIYSANDPGVLFDLYGGFTSYQIPGPRVWNGVGAPVDSAPKPTTSRPAAAPVTTSKALAAPVTTSKAPVAPKPTTLVTKPVTTAPAPSPVAGAVAKYGQCGGINYIGSKTCAAGSTCKEWNPYYFQCV